MMVMTQIDAEQPLSRIRCAHHAFIQHRIGSTMITTTYTYVRSNSKNGLNEEKSHLKQLKIAVFLKN